LEFIRAPRKLPTIPTSGSLDGHRHAFTMPRRERMRIVGNSETHAASAPRQMGLRTRLGRLAVRSRAVDARARAALQPSDFAAARRLFAYPPRLPLAVAVTGSRHEDDAIVQDFVFPSLSGDDISASLVRPSRSVSHTPSALFVHWLGHHNCNRDEFLDDALWLAAKGSISLLVDAQWSDKVEKVYEFDESTAIQQVIDLRRSLDVLLAQPGVDLARVAYIGHDYGAMYGSVLVGIDRRIRTAILMTPTAHLSDWNLIVKSRPDPDTYAARMAIYDPAVYLPHASLAGLMLQFARTDRYVSEQDARTIVDAAPEPKIVRWYDADHDLATVDARKDRLDWLGAQLNLG
jgi:predicted esterase